MIAKITRQLKKKITHARNEGDHSLREDNQLSHRVKCWDDLEGFEGSRCFNGDLKGS